MDMRGTIGRIGSIYRDNWVEITALYLAVSAVLLVAFGAHFILITTNEIPPTVEADASVEHRGGEVTTTLVGMKKADYVVVNYTGWGDWMNASLSEPNDNVTLSSRNVTTTGNATVTSMPEVLPERGDRIQVWATAIKNDSSTVVVDREFKLGEPNHSDGA